MARYLESTMLPAKWPVGDLTLLAVIIARNLAIAGLLVNPVRLHVKCAAPIPGAPSLVRSLVRRARKTVHGRVLTLEDVIYLALFLAKNCHARSAASQSWIVDISVPQFAERRAHRVTTASFAIRRKQKALWWTIYSQQPMVRRTLMRIRASCQIAAI